MPCWQETDHKCKKRPDSISSTFSSEGSCRRVHQGRHCWRLMLECRSTVLLVAGRIEYCCSRCWADGITLILHLLRTLHCQLKVAALQEAADGRVQARGPSFGAGLLSLKKSTDFGIEALGSEVSQDGIMHLWGHCGLHLLCLQLFNEGLRQVWAAGFQDCRHDCLGVCRACQQRMLGEVLGKLVGQAARLANGQRWSHCLQCWKLEWLRLALPPLGQDSLVIVAFANGLRSQAPLLGSRAWRPAALGASAQQTRLTTAIFLAPFQLPPPS